MNIYNRWATYANAKLELREESYDSDRELVMRFLFDHFDNVSKNKDILGDMAMVLADPVEFVKIERELCGCKIAELPIDQAEKEHYRAREREILRSRFPDYMLVVELMN